MRFSTVAMWRLLLWFGLAAAVPPDVLAAEARLLRFPTIHGDRIVFAYAGDLYTVSAAGGVARRLTSDPKSYEMFPRFSPDGKWLAFTAQYDGNTEVYAMPSEGGEPRRLTFTATLERDDVSDRMGPNNIVMTWRDNDSIVYRSRGQEWNAFKGRLMLVSREGGMSEPLPLPRGGWCSYSPDLKKLAYNRVFREFRTWKRYRGGQADDIWLYDFESRETTRMFPDAGQDMFPMWHGERIYFVSERDTNRQANLFVGDVKGGQVRQLTQFTEFAVKFPSLGDAAIVFENGGYIYRFDLASEKAEKVPIEILEDFASGRGGLRDVSKETTTYQIAPDGSRAVIGARGDVFTLPAKNGPTRNLTQTPGVHERSAVWSPNGKWAAYVSDQSGEDEVWIRPQDGQGQPAQVTRDGDTYKYDIAWSPNSEYLAWTDKENRLQYVNVESKVVTPVVQAKAGEIRDFSWAPDSQWIAYTQPEVRRYSNIYLYSLADQKSIPVTDGWFDVGSPEFSSDGKYLFFVSERSFNPTYSSTEWNHVYNDMQRIYLVTLAKDTPSPFAPKSDEVKLKDEKKDGDKPKDNPPDVKADEKKDGEKKEAKKVVVKVDSEGLAQRITVLPLPASTYDGLTSVGDKLYFLRKGKLYFYDLDKEKETEVGEVAGYRISTDQKKMLVKVGSEFAIVDLPAGKLEISEKKISLADMKVALDRPAEWSQIYRECWRQMRDYFYDPKLHQVDWEAMRQRYEPLLAHVRNRADLTYIIGELIGELSAGHAYVGGGDYPKPDRIPLGLLGAQVVRDPSGYFRVARILPGHNWEPKYRSPLTEIGVNVNPGDYILAINGKSTKGMPDLYAELVGTAGKQVKLTVNSQPMEAGARVETVVPTADEQPLYYLDWVLGNIAKVDKASDGRIGYVHIPDMGVPGLNEFAKFFYSQLHKEALVVDCRGNGGGNVSPMIIERLRREPAMWTVGRNTSVNVDPSAQVLGPKALLIDQFSASDGDIVGYRFRKHGLGPIIGQRSWGGVVGIRGSLPLLDGGYLNRPEFSRFDLAGKDWIMEGVGVSPDIEVDNDPAHEYEGQDDQLDRAITELKQAMEKQPVRVPEPPPYPDKRR